MKKQDKKIDLKNLTSKDKMKYEIAEELGICQQSVNRIMNQAVKRLRKNF